MYDVYFIYATIAHTHLPRSELPVCGHTVGRVHENFRNGVSFLDGLQLQAQQVAFDSKSSQCLDSEDRLVG